MSKNFDALGYYEILNVSFDETADVIKRQYYLQAKFWHPDHNKSPKALENFQKVSVAYDVLKEPQIRLQYDLLSLVYNQKDFPQIGSLKIYKNQSNKDDVALRVLQQRRTYSHFSGAEVKESKDVCNFREAMEMVLATSAHNWLKGWWGKGAIGKNIASLKFNYKSVEVSDADNFKLLIHNMLAYAQENQPEISYIYAKQALRYTNSSSRQYSLINRFMESLHFDNMGKVNIPYWSAKELRRRQLLIPSILILSLAVLILIAAVNFGWGGFIHRQTQSYFEQREFVGGVLMPYDMIDAHIIKVDSDIDSLKFVYHLSEPCTAYYGPDIRYDVMRDLPAGQTVRIIGYTANQKWMKLMFDDGETGFVQKKFLRKGIGKSVPQNSRVYRN